MLGFEEFKKQQEALYTPEEIAELVEQAGAILAKVQTEVGEATTAGKAIKEAQEAVDKAKAALPKDKKREPYKPSPVEAMRSRFRR